MDLIKKIKLHAPNFYYRFVAARCCCSNVLISGPNWSFECCKNGIVGTFPALNQRYHRRVLKNGLLKLKKLLAAFEKETGKKAAPFGVNLIVHPTNPRVQPDLEICIKHQVPLIITSLGAVSDLSRMQFTVMVG